MQVVHIVHLHAPCVSLESLQWRSSAQRGFSTESVALTHCSTARRSSSHSLSRPPPLLQSPLLASLSHSLTPTLPSPQHFFASNDKAEDLLGWKPQFGLVDGLRDSYLLDFSRGTFRKAADFETDDMILAKKKAPAAVSAAV